MSKPKVLIFDCNFAARVGIENSLLYNHLEETFNSCAYLFEDGSSYINFQSFKEKDLLLTNEKGERFIKHTLQDIIDFFDGVLTPEQINEHLKELIDLAYIKYTNEYLNIVNA